MWALIGFAVGFGYGVKAGPEGVQRLRDSWESVKSSEEARAMLKAGMATVVGGVEESRGLWSMVRRQIANRLSEERERLVRIA